MFPASTLLTRPTIGLTLELFHPSYREAPAVMNLQTAFAAAHVTPLADVSPVQRMEAAESVISEFPALSAVHPRIAGALAAWDAKVAADGPGSLQAPGIIAS